MNSPDYVLTLDDISSSLFAGITIYDDHHKPIIREYSQKTHVITQEDLFVPTITGEMIEDTIVLIISALQV